MVEVEAMKMAVDCLTTRWGMPMTQTDLPDDLRPGKEA
jgi:hypothetical protein